MPRDTSRRNFLKQAGGGLAAAAWTRRARAADIPSAPPNIMVVVVDTLRRDNLGCYGYERPTSPFIDALAKQSRRYTNAYSTSCWTVPSHASLFTGLYPSAHGTTWEHYEFDKDLNTLPALLQAKEYRTFGFSENPAINVRSGFSRGFDQFSNPKRAPKKMRNNAHRAFQRALGTVGKQPFFAFVNLNAPHDPYNSSAQFFGTFLTDERYRNQTNVNLLKVLIDGKPINEIWCKHLTEHYDAEIRYTDLIVQTMVNELKIRGLWENTIFILTTDHGENLGEHNLLNHQFCLYETLVRVPLLVRWPERFAPGSTEENFVQLTDVFPTLLELAGLDLGAYPSQGYSLLPGKTVKLRQILCEYYIHARFASPEKFGDRWLNPRVQKYRRRLKSIRVGHAKYISASDGSEELYDLLRDPGELSNLAGREDRTAAKEAMKRMLARKLERVQSHRQPGAAKTAPMDEENKEMFEALGYFLAGYLGILLAYSFPPLKSKRDHNTQYPWTFSRLVSSSC